MKSFIVVFLVIATITGSAFCGKAEWEADANACSEKHNVKMEDMKDIFQGKNKDVTADQKCFFLCMGEKMGTIKDGAFQAQVFSEKMANHASKEQIDKITSECSVKGSDDCDTAFKVMSCIGKIKHQ